MAQIKLFKFDTDGMPVEHDPTADELTIASLTMDSGGAGIDMNTTKVFDMGSATSDGDALAYGQSGANLAGLTIDTADLVMSSRKITSLADGSAASDAVNKGQLDTAVIVGGNFKEAILHENQANDVEGILGALAFTIASQPVSGDLFTLTDGTTTRTYGATAGGDIQYTIGGTVAVTMANLAAAIQADGSAIWGAYFTTDLDAIDADGVIVVIEDDNDGTASEVYGVWATQASAQMVDFSGDSDYTSKTLTEMPAANPASTNFGFRRTQASLTDGELHYALNNDVVYGWDDSGNTWQTMSGSASIPDATGASGGGTKGKATYDTDLGLAVSGGVVSLNVTANIGLHFNSGALEIELDNTPDTLDADASGLKVVGLPSLFKINDVAVSANVDSAALGVLTAGVASDADGEHTHDGKSDTGHTHTHASTTGQGTDDHHAQSHTVASHSDTTATGAELDELTDGSTTTLHVHAGTAEAERIETGYTTDGTGVTKGDPLYVSANGIVSSCNANNDNSRLYIGVAKSTVGASAAVDVVSAGKLAAVTITAAAAGALVYLKVGGGLTCTIPAYTSGNHRLVVGKCANTVGAELQIEPQYIGKVN